MRYTRDAPTRPPDATFPGQLSVSLWSSRLHILWVTVLPTPPPVAPANSVRRPAIRLLTYLFAALPSLISCERGNKQVIVGDAVPRSRAPDAFVHVLEDWMDSTDGRGLKRVAISELNAESLGSEVAQAEAFAKNPSVMVVVGHSGSRNTLLAAPVYREAGLPLIVPTATAGQLRSTSTPVFMLAPTDSVEGAFIANYAVDSIKSERVAVVYVADAYGVGIRDGVAAQLLIRGRSVVGEAALSGRECASADRLAVRGTARSLLQRSRPTVIVLAASSRLSGCLMREIFSVDSTIHMIASDSYERATAREFRFTPFEKSLIDYVVFWEPGTDSLSQELVERTRRVAHRAPQWSDALTYDAFHLVAAAVRDGVSSRAEMTRWLKSLGTSAHAPIMGVTGPISFEKPRSTMLRMRSQADSIP